MLLIANATANATGAFFCYPPHFSGVASASSKNKKSLGCLKGDMQRFFTELTKKWFLAAYCNINPSV